MRRILVLRGGALGDFIVTLPALAALRQRWPQARVELVGNATAATLALRRGLLDSVHSQQDARWGELYSAAPLSRELSQWLAAFDLVINFWPDPDGELAGRFPLHAGQQFVAGGAHPETAPAARHFIDALAPLGLPPIEPFVRLRPVRASTSAPVSDVRRVILHPGSGSPRKNWPLSRWQELAAWLIHERHHPLAIVSGPAEDLPPLKELGIAWRNRPLEELVAEFTQCTLFVGHDSGISHLAAACGTRCVLLFGPTNPAIWAPPGPNVAVVRDGPELSTLSFAAVHAAVDAALS